ncbi:MAG: FG-GAP repeat domain-containing protein, partial [Acutalibacteraceae bacterium]
MKKFTWAIIIICLLSAALFIIYGLEIKPVESLIRPPEYSDEGGSVQLALEAEIGKIYFLKTPTQGENRSAFIYHDFDGDGTKEAVVLYSELKNPDSVTMSIFRQNDTSWKRITSVSCPYAEVMQVDFADINGNGADDIIVGYSIYGSEITQHLFVYSINSLDRMNPSITVRYDTAYSKYAVIDVDSDKCFDLLVLNSADSGGKFGYNAEVISFGQKDSGKKASIELDSALRIVSDISFDCQNTGVRIYIDGYTADGKMVTDMVSWNVKKKNLERNTYQGKSIASITTRTKTSVCADINSDGLIDMPTDYVLPASKALGSGSVKNISLLNFVFLSKNKLVSSGYYLENADNGYYFKISKSLI